MWIGEVVKYYNPEQTEYKLQKNEVHLKINPILDPVHLMMNKYNLEHHTLPNMFSYLTQKKLNHLNNTTYVEAFFYYLASLLVEKGKCPSFPYFYGTYLGIADEFKQDVSDEYNSMKHCSWFSENYQKTFDLHKVSLEEHLINCENENENENKFEELDGEKINVSELVTGDLEELDLDLFMSDASSRDESNESSDSDDYSDVSSNSDSSSEDGSDLSSFESEINDAYYYTIFKDLPVQIIAIEGLDKTLDELVDSKYHISDVEWASILFQTCFGLSVAQKQFEFTHNDLHSGNIMFKPTGKKYMYFCINGTYYQVPTFGKITKIIDFARAIYKFRGFTYFSDVFKKDGDAEGQYSYPYFPNSKLKYPPNPSFDLCYLAITIHEHFDKDSRIGMLMEKWMTDKYGYNLSYHPVNFDLYVKIAHNMENAVPLSQFKESLFKQFMIKKTNIPNGTYVYIY